MALLQDNHFSCRGRFGGYQLVEVCSRCHRLSAIIATIPVCGARFSNVESGGPKAKFKIPNEFTRRGVDADGGMGINRQLIRHPGLGVERIRIVGEQRGGSRYHVVRRQPQLRERSTDISRVKFVMQRADQFSTRIADFNCQGIANGSYRLAVHIRPDSVQSPHLNDINLSGALVVYG